jgi:hypothetical protein
MQQNQCPFPPPAGPRHYGEQSPDRTAVFEDPGLTQSLDRPGALDATAPIWLGFGPGVPAAATQDPDEAGNPGRAAESRGSGRRRRAVISFISLLTVAGIVVRLGRTLHGLP